MKSVSLPIFSEVKAAADKPLGWPVFRLGFRPFYLGGTLLAALSVPLWVAMYLGGVQVAPAVSPLLWHAHEMLFGFVIAIIVGFLLTAGKSWTGLATPRGPLLAGLVVLWLAARLASLTGSAVVYAVLDVALLPLVAAIFAKVLWQSKNYRNLPLALILALLAGTNLVFHLAASQGLHLPAMTALHAALALIIMIESVIAGRVIPAFTMGAMPGLRLVASTTVERLTLGLTAAGLLCWVFAPHGIWGMLILCTAAVLHAKRWWGWQPQLGRSPPILWVLQLAYLWIPLGLLLLGLAQMSWLADSVGVHALSVGATAGLIIGMVTRTARGHTGRALSVSLPEVVAYALVAIAALARVGLPLLSPALHPAALVLAAAAWSSAFLTYLWVYTPWLTQTRLDGKDG